MEHTKNHFYIIISTNSISSSLPLISGPLVHHYCIIVMVLPTYDTHFQNSMFSYPYPDTALHVSNSLHKKAKMAAFWVGVIDCIGRFLRASVN